MDSSNETALKAWEAVNLALPGVHVDHDELMKLRSLKMRSQGSAASTPAPTNPTKQNHRSGTKRLRRKPWTNTSGAARTEARTYFHKSTTTPTTVCRRTAQTQPHHIYLFPSSPFPIGIIRQRVAATNIHGSKGRRSQGSNTSTSSNTIR